MRVICATVLLAGGLLFPVFSQKQEMTYERYLTELNAVVQREKTAREEIAGEQARIESLRQQISALDLRIAGVIQETYTILGITELDVNNAEIELSSMKSILGQLVDLSNIELVSRRQEAEQLDARFNALKGKRVSQLFRVAEKMREIEPLLSQVLRQLHQALAGSKPANATFSTSTYTVGLQGRGKNLSQIAAELYGDQYQWPRIYRANKTLIDKRYERYKNSVDSLKIIRPQDFVLPGWTLEIPH